MKTWQSIAALKKVKAEIETVVARLGSALEAVIATPAGDSKALAPLQPCVDDFARVPGILGLLECSYLGLLAKEILLLLQDTLDHSATLDTREVELRLESAFVATTDLPALLEYCLRQSIDSFAWVSQLVNRLRKARGCALVFAGEVLLEKPEVNFGSLFSTDADTMQETLSRQVDFYARASKALTANPDDDRALKLLSNVLGNLELLLRDHKVGVLWGLGRALVEVYRSGACKRPQLAACFAQLVPSAEQLRGGAAALQQAGIDPTLLEKLVDIIAGAGVDSGRPGIIKLWYNLSISTSREFRAGYRQLQVSYYNKAALGKSLRLVKAEIRDLLATIDQLAGDAAPDHDSMDAVFVLADKLGRVLQMLRLHYLADYLTDIVAASVQSDGNKPAELLARAAVVLYRIDRELTWKLDTLARELFMTDTLFAPEDAISSGRQQVLQTAITNVETVLTTLEEHADALAHNEADAQVPGWPGRARLERAHVLLDGVACVLDTIALPQQAQQLATARAYLASLLSHNAPQAIDANFEALAHLLIHSSRHLTQLALGRDHDAQTAAGPVAVLQNYLAAAPPANVELTRARLVFFASEPDATAALPLPEAEPVIAEPVLVHVPLLLPAPMPEAELAVLGERAQPLDTVAAPQVEAEELVASTAVVAASTEESDDPSLLAVFLDEADELLQALDALYLKWRQQPRDQGCLDEYLRILHTIKGSAAIVCEHELSKCAHDYETFILAAQQPGHALDAAFFAACDSRLHALHDICRLYQKDTDGHLLRMAPAPAAASEPEVAVTAAITPEPPVASAETAEAAPAASAPELVEATTLDKSPQPVMETPPPAPDEQVRVSSRLLRSLQNDADEINFSRSRIENSFDDIGALLGDMDETLNRLLACVKHFEHRAGTPPAGKTGAGSGGHSSSAAEFDALEMDRYTGLQELALTLTEDYNDLQDIRVNLATKVKDIDNILSGQQRLTNSLQGGLISSQMVPFASIVPRLGRLVRQISGKLGKQVRLEVENRQGSLDKNMLQAIVTPLEHIIRNAIDHGIEAPEQRERLGKRVQATLRIAVSRKGTGICIEIRDDGQGINIDKVLEQARRKGLVAPGAEVGPAEVYRLLFQPGFSTSNVVSSISGRGVGLDVVKSEIEQIGGAVDVESVRGGGTAFFINLPLTSSLNRALLFEIQGARYVVLMNTLDGVLLDKLGSLLRKQQEGTPVFEYGGNSYEYLYLGRLLDASFKPPLDSIDNSISLLLVSDNGRRYALHVDAIVESRDLVVKAFGKQFAAMPGIAGGVIMPDGNVAIVLDLKSLVALPGQAPHPAIEVPLSLAGAGSAGKQRRLVMVVDDSITVRKVTTAMLKRNGMDVVTASNGLEALELLRNTVPDMILLDIEMPKMDGFAVAAHVRAQPKPLGAIPIIMITSRIGDKHRNRAEQIGVNQYICKPFQEDNLLQSLRSY